MLLKLLIVTVDTDVKGTVLYAYWDLDVAEIWLELVKKKKDCRWFPDHSFGEEFIELLCFGTLTLSPRPDLSSEHVPKQLHGIQCMAMLLADNRNIYQKLPTMGETDDKKNNKKSKNDKKIFSF